MKPGRQLTFDNLPMPVKALKAAPEFRPVETFTQKPARAARPKREGAPIARCGCGAWAAWSWGPPLVAVRQHFCGQHRPADFFTRGTR
jgi:hypothetical protein